MHASVYPLPMIGVASKECVLNFIIVVAPDSLLQAQRARIDAHLVQLDKEAAEAAADLRNAENRLVNCTDPAEKALLKEIYNNRVAKEKRLDELRSNLVRQLTGAKCPWLEWFCAGLLAVNRGIKGACALRHRAA